MKKSNPKKKSQLFFSFGTGSHHFPASKLDQRDPLQAYHLLSTTIVSTMGCLSGAFPCSFWLPSPIHGALSEHVVANFCRVVGPLYAHIPRSTTIFLLLTNITNKYLLSPFFLSFFFAENLLSPFSS